MEGAINKRFLKIYFMKKMCILQTLWPLCIRTTNVPFEACREMFRNQRFENWGKEHKTHKRLTNNINWKLPPRSEIQVIALKKTVFTVLFNVNTNILLHFLTTWILLFRVNCPFKSDTNISYFEVMIYSVLV